MLIQRVLAGETLRTTERKTGINDAQIHKWTKKYSEVGEEAIVYSRLSLKVFMLLCSFLLSQECSLCCMLIRQIFQF